MKIARSVTALALVSWCGAAVSAVENEFLDLSLQELLSVEITSAGKKPQPVSQAAAAIFVITQEDIRHSGVTSIPEALRMAPGLDVARIDGNKWAISSRGFNGRFANKLLVMIDGRSVYSPTFAGVYWDVQDTLLEDVDRIEVIRGPGASLWGSNAVNGVINIITKSSANTQGGLISAGAGNYERGFGGVRYGGDIGDLGHYRVYAKYFNRGNNAYADSREIINDQSDQYRGGFRTDLTPSLRDQVTVQGDYYHGRSGDGMNLDTPIAPDFSTYVRNQQKLTGFNVLSRWQHSLTDTDTLTVQAYYDYTERRRAILDERRRTGDLDIQYRTQRFQGHDVMFGFGYRYTEDFTGATYKVSMDPRNRGTQLYSAFLQDDIQLIKNELTLTLGSKLEHNDYSGFEGQPNLRLLWTPDKNNTVWGSIGRAVRIPSRGDQDVRAIQQTLTPANSPAPVPVVVKILGSRQFDAESVIAYELGYKHRVSDQFSFDLATFYNEYTRLRSVAKCSEAIPIASCLNQSSIPWISDSRFGNQGGHHSYGVELAFDWRPAEQWRFQGVYAFLQMEAHAIKSGHTLGDSAGSNPVHQASLRTSWSPRRDVDLDLWIRRVDGLNIDFGTSTSHIPGYTQLDLRLAWRPVPKLELSFVGFNLLDDRHKEFVSEYNDVPPVEIRRSLFGQVRWEFE